MAMTDPDLRIDGERPIRGFRPSARRRSRMAIGAALAAVAIGGNVIVYSNLDQRTEVLQVVRDVPAGAQLVAADLRPVQVGADASVRIVSADQVGSVVGQHAKVRLVAGSLVVTESLQPAPLVSPGAAVVAVQVPEGALPLGLRERSQVQLVLAPGRTGDVDTIVVVPGRVVGLPVGSSAVTGRVSLSVEVDEPVAATVAASDDVRVVLMEPGTDAASTAAVAGS